MAASSPITVHWRVNQLFSAQATVVLAHSPAASPHAVTHSCQQKGVPAVLGQLHHHTVLVALGVCTHIGGGIYKILHGCCPLLGQGEAIFQIPNAYHASVCQTNGFAVGVHPHTIQIGAVCGVVVF